MTWAPPAGAQEVEPGFWEAPNGDVYSDPIEWERWQAERKRDGEEYEARRERERQYEDYRLSVDDRRKLRGQLVARHLAFQERPVAHYPTPSRSSCLSSPINDSPSAMHRTISSGSS